MYKRQENNKFIMAMKIYGGGHLIKEAEKAFKYIDSLNYVDSIAIGMSTVEELSLIHISLRLQTYLQKFRLEFLYLYN